jgi:hypothetical protein
MAISDRGPASPSTGRTPVFVYLAVLLVAILIIAGGSTIWLSTGTSGTNSLASDPQAISPTVH